MKFLFAPLVLLWRIWFCLLASFAVILVAIPLLIFIQKEKYYAIVWQIMRFWAFLVFYGTGLRYTRQQSKPLNPNQQYVFVANHTSLMDVMLMMILHPKHNCVFVGKEELSKYPIFGLIYRRTNILVNRANKESRMRVFKQAKAKIDLGRNIIIFPEGGVPDNESIVLDHFKDGAFAIAIANKLPIVVYTFVGMKEAFPYAYFRGKPSTIQMFTEAVIPTKNKSTKELKSIKKQAFDLIDNRLKQNANYR